MVLYNCQWTKFGFTRVIGRLRPSTILYPWLFYFPFNTPQHFLSFIKLFIQHLISLADPKIRVLYFGEVDVELVLIQQLRQ